MRLGWLDSTGPPVLGFRSFNEAEARAPRMAPSESDAVLRLRRFNEAEARAPRMDCQP